MASAASVAVPSSYEELVRTYERDIRATVRRCIPWAESWDREDVTQYILGQLLPDPEAKPPRRGVIEQFEPGKAAERAKDPFRAFILAKVKLYCKGKSQALATHYSRELSIADVAVGDGSSTWIEQVTEEPGDGCADLDDDETLQRLRDHLAACPPAPGQPHLLDLFDEMAELAGTGRKVSAAAVRQKFGGTPAQAASYLDQLRSELREAAQVRPGEPMVDLGVAVMTAAEVLRAADILKGNPGNQVVKPWERAGHRLAGYGKTWYLAPAKAELARYPHLRGSRGGHYEGGHGSPVRRGLIHWLERVAGRPASPPPAPPPPAPRPGEAHFDQLEAALWQLPGSDVAKVDEVLALAKKVFGT